MMCGTEQPKQTCYEQDQALDGGAIRHRRRVSHSRIRPDRRRGTQNVRAVVPQTPAPKAQRASNAGPSLFIYLPIHHFFINGKD